MVQVVSSSVLVRKLLAQKSIWARLLTLQGLFSHSLCLPLQQLYHGDKHYLWPCHHASAWGWVVASEEDFQISNTKIAQTSLNNHIQWFCPLIAPAKVKPLFLLKTPCFQGLHDVIIKMNSRWKPATQILTGAVNFRPNLTACRQVVFLTQHLSLSQLLKQKGGPFALTCAKLGCSWAQARYQFTMAAPETTVIPSCVWALRKERRKESKFGYRWKKEWMVFLFRYASSPSVHINHFCCY